MSASSGKRIALVTGGAQGIGHGIAQRLAAEGFELAIADLQPEADAKPAMDALRAAGRRVLYCRGDISAAADRTAILAAIQAEYRRLDVLVNNAGVAPKIRLDLLDMTEESYERVMRINLQGPLFLTQAVARWMIEQRQADPAFAGCIVNISSISADTASVSRGEYCLSKAGVSMMTKLFAVRLAEHNLPVYEVRPGIIETPMTAGVKEKYDKLIADGLLLQARWGTPADIGKAVAMLARGDLAYSTGQVVNLDGGFAVSRL
jgi:NAD(P)-dependent dehydrogenase (short-subunit alcohol dehydrogenase family)